MKNKNRELNKLLDEIVSYLYHNPQTIEGISIDDTLVLTKQRAYEIETLFRYKINENKK